MPYPKIAFEFDLFRSGNIIEQIEEDSYLPRINR